ncbi:MAG TPA: alpha/beta fold hydrolase [Polyangiaceae bacterium]|nr:alpha/beta fold hydrolase [Polyangiaceae bacterium]
MSSVFDGAAFNRALFVPRRDRSAPPPGARDHFVDVEGARLHLRVHDGAGLAKVTLLFHGNGEVVADYDGAAEAYARHAGSALAVVDFRGYGLSTGVPTLRDAIADARPALDAARAAAGGRPLVIVGRSLGGACAAELCRAEHFDVAGYVFESAPADLAALVRRRGLPVPDFSPDEIEAFDPLTKLARCARPALVLHGERDTLITPAEARLSFDALAGCPRTLALVPGRGHNDVSLHPAYWQALADFYAGLGAPAAPPAAPLAAG